MVEPSRRQDLLTVHEAAEKLVEYSSVVDLKSHATKQFSNSNFHGVQSSSNNVTCNKAVNVFSACQGTSFDLILVGCSFKEQ